MRTMKAPKSSDNSTRRAAVEQATGRVLTRFFGHDRDRLRE